MNDTDKNRIREAWKERISRSVHGFFLVGGKIDFNGIADWWLNVLSRETERVRKEEQKLAEENMYSEDQVTLLEIEAAEIGRSEEREKSEILADSLIDMYGQYCDDGHAFMSAGEHASALLERYGYASFDQVGRMVKIIIKKKDI